MKNLMDRENVPPMLDDLERPLPPPLSGEKKSRPGAGLAIFVGLFGCFALGGIIWYSFNEGSFIGSGNDIPVVKADQSSIRIRPDNPGGLNVPNKDKLVLKSLTSSNHATPEETEKLIAQPELPVNLSLGKSKLAVETKIVESNKRPTVQIQKPESNQSSVPPKVTKPKNKPFDDVTLADKTANDVNPLKKNVISKNDKRAMRPSKKVGTHRVQLASLRNELAAIAFWKSIRKKYEKMLAKMQGRIQSVKIKNKGTFYRVQGDVVSKERAQQICGILRKRGQACILVVK